MSTVEQEIIDRLHHMEPDEQRMVLEFIQSLPPSSQKPYSARELMKLPAAERDRIVAEAFKLAEDEEFEIFEAYSEEPLNDES